MKKTLLLSMLLAVLCISASVCATTLPGDSSGDWKVDLGDFAIMASYWMTDWSSSFVTTWDTSLGTNTTVTLALAGSVNATIDWGDGTTESVTGAGPHVHDYGDDGIYTVSVAGTVTEYNSYDWGGSTSERKKLISVDDWGQTGFVNLNFALDGCSNLVSVPNNTNGLEAVTDMSYMFYQASSFNGNISSWDTSSVIYMDGMFFNASSFNGNIGGWDTSSVTDMYEMFWGAVSFNQNIGGWCVTQITSEPTDFDTGATSWTDLRPAWGTCPDPVAFRTTWDTSLGTNTTVTLALAGSVNATIDWGDGTTESVTGAGPHVHDYGVDGIYMVSVAGTVTEYDSGIYGGLSTEQDKLIRVNNWGQTGFDKMSYAFTGCSNLVSVPNNTNGLEAVTDMKNMFLNASSFNGNIGGWDTSSVTDMSYMFQGASVFNGSIGGWDTSNVNNMSYMFLNASSFNGNIGGWDTSSVTDMSGMFFNASSFNQYLDEWCVTLIPSPPSNFETGATSWTLFRPDWGFCL